MTKLTNDEIRQNVRSRYKQVAVQEANAESCCHPNIQATSRCTTSSDFNTISSTLGYSNEELESVPDGANLGLGCGNPQAIASLKPGEVVLDLGAVVGLTAFSVPAGGETGSVIGVDMTPEMVSRARNNATKGNFVNTDFRLGKLSIYQLLIIRWTSSSRIV